MLTTTNMGIKVDPICLNNVNLMRYVRPNISSSSVQRTRRCLFGRSDPEQNKRIYENSANNERNRCIERYGFDPVRSEYVENENERNDNVNLDENVDERIEIVNLDENVQQSLDNVVVKQCDDIANDRENENKKASLSIVNDVIKYKLDDVHGSRTQRIKRPHESDHQKTGK